MFKLEEDKNKDKLREQFIESIINLFEPRCRKYLSVFDIERDPSLTDIIFKAVDSGKTIRISSAPIVSKTNLFSSSI